MTWTVRVILLLLIATFAIARFCHIDIMWVEEAYPTAAAMEILRGKMLYRDIWFDKPPLYALVYTFWGAQIGFWLRFAGSLYLVLCCGLIFRFAQRMWGEREAVLATFLLGFYLTFGIPSAVIALAPDLLMVAPHIAAVYLAWRGRAFWSGVLVGIALLVNTKAVFVLAACLLWVWPEWWKLLVGFAVPNVLFMGYLAANGALGDYYLQIWKWGFLYSKAGFPISVGVSRTLNWAGFQITALIGAVWCFRRDRKMLGWALISLVGVTAGWRFFPRYYFQLLPVICLAGARGLVEMRKRWRIAAVALMVIPLARFGPGYLTLANDLIRRQAHEWSDIRMNQDSFEAARIITALARTGDTLLVWGYRPDIFVYSRLPAATRYLDSQPLDGVLADRHLTNSTPIAADWAAANRRAIANVRPSFIVDGLGLLNPKLSVDKFLPMQDYRIVGRTALSVIYRLSASPDGRALPEKR